MVLWLAQVVYDEGHLSWREHLGGLAVARGMERRQQGLATVYPGHESVYRRVRVGYVGA